MAQRASLRDQASLGVEKRRSNRTGARERLLLYVEDNPANAMPYDIEKGLQAGFFRYITKPINVSEFMDTLNTALEFAERGMGKGSRTPR